MLRASLLRLSSASRPLGTAGSLGATPHRLPLPLHPSSSRRRTFMRLPTRLARMSRSRGSKLQQAKTSRHPFQRTYGGRRKSLESYRTFRGLLSRTVREALSHPTIESWGYCIIVVSGLGACAMAWVLHRTFKSFKDWVKNLWLGIKNSPGRAIERAKTVSRKWKLDVSEKIEKIKEGATFKCKNAVAIGRVWKAKSIEEAKKRQDAVSDALEETQRNVKRIFSHNPGARNGKSEKEIESSKVKTEERLREKQKRIKSEREGS